MVSEDDFSSRIDCIYYINKINKSINSLKDKLAKDGLSADKKKSIAQTIAEYEQKLMEMKSKLGIINDAPILINEKKCYVCGRSEADFKNIIDSISKEYDNKIRENEVMINEIYLKIKKNKEEGGKTILNQLKELEGIPLLGLKVETIIIDLPKFRSKIPHLDMLLSHKKKNDETLDDIIERLKAHYNSKSIDLYPQLYNKALQSNENTTITSTIDGVKPNAEDSKLLKAILVLENDIRVLRDNKKNFIFESGLYLNEYNLNMYISVHICGLCSEMFKDASKSVFEKKLDFNEYRLENLYKMRKDYNERLGKIGSYIHAEEARQEEEEDYGD